jgi:hypothetical protein
MNRRTRRLDALLRRPRQIKPTFLRERITSDDFYEGILVRIASIEELLRPPRAGKIRDSLRIVFEVFPLLEYISYCLFYKSGRHYLEKLGYSRRESDVMYRMFRNGHAHGLGPYSLEYLDGNVTWELSSGSGSGPPLPYDPGFVNEDHPENNLLSEKVFEYVRLPDNSYHASLKVDRLLAQLRYDIDKRKQGEPGYVEIIIGQKINERRRRTS